MLLVEDLMTDGGEIQIFDAVTHAKCNNSGLFVIFNYGIIENNLSHKKINLIYLTNWNYVLRVALKKNFKG